MDSTSKNNLILTKEKRDLVQNGGWGLGGKGGWRVCADRSVNPTSSSICSRTTAEFELDLKIKSNQINTLRSRNVGWDAKTVLLQSRQSSLANSRLSIQV